MGDTKIKVGGKLFAVTASGELAEASQIIDVNHGNKNQQDINQELKEALAKKIETVDPELLEDSVNPVQNKAVYQALVDGEQVIAAALNDLNTRLTRKKRIYMKFAQSTQAPYEGSWLSASPGETVCMAIQTGTAAKSLIVTVIPLDANKATPALTVTKVGTSSLSEAMVFWKVAITIPEDVEDDDIYLYKYTTSAT